MKNQKEQFKRVSDKLMNKENLYKKADRRTRIINVAILYGQTPQELLRNPEISLQAKALYGILHTLAETKELISKPTIWKSGEKISKEYAGISQSFFSKCVSILEKFGWIANIRRGLGKGNIIVLYGRPSFPTDNEKELIKEEVEREIKTWKEK